MNTIKELNTIKLAGDIRIDALQDYPALLNFIVPNRNILYYTFDVSPGSVAEKSTLNEQKYVATPNSALKFSIDQQNAVHSILKHAGSLTGIVFQEVASSAEADFHFVSTDLIKGTSGGEYSYFSKFDSRIVDGAATLIETEVESVVWMDNTYPLDMSVGSFDYDTLLHEIGHALGLGHPFESTVQSPNNLPKDQDHADNTVMSYSGGPSNTNASVFAPYDQLALKWIYGGDGLGGTWGYNSINGPSLNPTIVPKPAVPDTLAPQFAWSSPAGGAVAVPLARNLVLTFNEAMQRGIGNLVLKTADDVVVETFDMTKNTTNVTVKGKLLTVNPSLDLLPSTKYFLDLPNGAIKDLAGNGYTGGKLEFTSQAITGTNTGIAGTDRNDQLSGSDKDDLIEVGLGQDEIDGGAGIDTVVLKISPSAHVFSQTETGSIVGKYSGNSVTLKNVELVQFGKFHQTTVSVERVLSGEVKAQVEQLTDLYLAYFGRAPDQEGLEFWQKQLIEGNQTLDQITNNFGFSQEALTLFPQTATNREFVRKVYVNALGREPDAGGWDYWTKTLDESNAAADPAQRAKFVTFMLMAVHAPTSGPEDRTKLANKHDVALYYVDQLAQQSEDFFDPKINDLLASVSLESASKDKAIAVIDYTLTNPITLSGVMADQLLYDSIG